jgi:hypothetical protein
LAKDHFDDVDSQIRRNLLRIPYSHLVLACSSPRAR